VINNESLTQRTHHAWKNSQTGSPLYKNTTYTPPSWYRSARRTQLCCVLDRWNFQNRTGQCCLWRQQVDHLLDWSLLLAHYPKRKTSQEKVYCKYMCTWRSI